MASRELEPLLGTSHFRVRIGRRELGFSEISRLTSATVETEDGRREAFETVILRRALGDSRELFDWRKQVADGRSGRRTVTISQLDTPGGRIVNSWQLVGAWPVRWSGPAFDASSTGVALEEIELAFDDLVWLAKPNPPKRGA